MSTIEHAIIIAAKAHNEQIDKAGLPYILHPLRVMLKLKTKEEQIAAVLHDVVEDTDVTLEFLKNEGFSDTIIFAVDFLTRRSEEKYKDFIARVAKNKISLNVKLADLADNIDLSRIENPTEVDHKRVKKYLKALSYLTEVQEIYKAEG